MRTRKTLIGKLGDWAIKDGFWQSLFLFFFCFVIFLDLEQYKEGKIVKTLKKHGDLYLMALYCNLVNFAAIFSFWYLLRGLK